MNRSIVSNLSQGACLLAVLLTVAGTAGCATGMPQSGFLKDYSGFESVPPDDRAWSYIDPTGQIKDQNKLQLWFDRVDDAKVKKYKRIIVEPVVVQLKPGAEGRYVDPDRLKKLADDMTDLRASTFKGYFTVVDEPGEGVLRARTAIVEAFPAYVYRTQDLDRNPAKTYFNSTPGGAAFESEIVDSVSGERLFGVIGSGSGSTYEVMQRQEEWGQAKRALSGLAAFIRSRLGEIFGKNP